MMELAYTVHARDMLNERAIPDAWVVRAVESPLRTENHDDGTTHYLSEVPERSGRTLRVVVYDDGGDLEEALRPLGLDRPHQAFEPAGAVEGADTNGDVIGHAVRYLCPKSSLRP